MIRKTIIAFAAIATVAGAALVPTTASAWGKHHHWHGGFGWGVPFIDVAPVADCYFVEKMNRFGQIRMVRVCY